MKEFCLIFGGLVLVFGWVSFWFNRDADDNWPTWICFPMGVLMPVAAVVAAVIRSTR